MALLLRGAHLAGLLTEWLQLLGRHGARLPARFPPNLLDAAARQPRLRPWVAPVLGERGQWLARRQPAWNWACPRPTQPSARWDTGSTDQRVAVLRDWREDDPAGARRALSDAWPAELPEQRAALLRALAVRLSDDDKDFLESALDDRRKEVRAAAQRLLARLAGSRLSHRMLARLLPLMQVERRLLRAPRLQLTLPAERDAAMRRDGIGADPRSGLGEKAGWVVDMLAAVDPPVWLDRFGDAPDGARTPQALLALAEGSEFAAVLVRRLGTGKHAASHERSGILAAHARPMVDRRQPGPAQRHARQPVRCAGPGVPPRRARWPEHPGRRFPRRVVPRSAAGAPTARAGAPGRRQLAGAAERPRPAPHRSRPAGAAPALDIPPAAVQPVACARSGHRHRCRQLER